MLLHNKILVVLRRLLQAGSSVPWPDLLQDITGNPRFDATAMLEYFDPLSLWLDDFIFANNVPVGWN